MKLFLVAAEASGDALAADLIAALRARDPGIELAGIGGAAMRAAGIESAVPIDGLAVLGLFDGMKAWRRVVRKADQAAAAIAAFAPDAVVLIDSWGFTLRVAHRVRGVLPRVPLVKYIGPQIWATRPGRAKTLAAAVDHLICIHDFEVPYYTPYGLPCTVAGHPAIGRAKQGDADAFRARHGLASDTPLAVVLPGSRPSELARVAPTLWRAASLLQARFPDLRLAAVAAASVAARVRDEAPREALIVDEGEKDDAFAAATVALAASGTVTTEAALQGAPLVVGYRVGDFTYALVQALDLYKAPFATLLNVAAAREVAPEFLQQKFTADNIAAAATLLLTDAGARAAQIAAQNEALMKMGRGGKPAAEIAADTILKIAREGRPQRLPIAV